MSCIFGHGGFFNIYITCNFVQKYFGIYLRKASAQKIDFGIYEWKASAQKIDFGICGLSSERF